MTPAELLATATDLLETPREATSGAAPSWAPRAATIDSPSGQPSSRASGRDT